MNCVSACLLYELGSDNVYFRSPSQAVHRHGHALIPNDFHYFDEKFSTLRKNDKELQIF